MLQHRGPDGKGDRDQECRTAEPVLPFDALEPLPISIGASFPYNAAVLDSALLTPVEVLPADADLAPLLVRLVAEMDQVRAEMATLRRENLKLR